MSKSISLFLAFIVLVSTTCFGADLHFCEDEIQSFSLYAKAEPCSKHDQVKTKKLPKCCQAIKAKQARKLESKLVLKKKKCCHNEQVAFKSDLNKQSAAEGISLVSFSGLTYGYFLAKTNFILLSEDIVSFFESPPDHHNHPNFQILYQVFII